MIYLAITAVICIVDLTIKHYVESRLELNALQERPSKVLKIKRMHNRGIALNGFDNHPGAVAAVTGIVTAFVAFIYGVFLYRKERGSAVLGLAMLTGGALSNTYDRIKRGYVVDYAAFRTGWKRFDRVFFNIADFFIMAGCAVTAVSNIFGRK